VGYTHVLKVRGEAGVVSCEVPAAEETLEGRCALLILVVRDLLVTAAVAAVAGFNLFLNPFLDLCVECIAGDGR
jgi:hypothetical protein